MLGACSDSDSSSDGGPRRRKRRGRNADSDDDEEDSMDDGGSMELKGALGEKEEAEDEAQKLYREEQSKMMNQGGMMQ